MKAVSLLSALVLGLLTVAAKSNFDARTKSIEQFAANLRLLDREIQNFNPEIEGLKDQLRQYTAQKILLIWPRPDAKNRGLHDNPQDLRSLEGIVQKIREFAPASEAQRFVQASALQIAGELTRTRWTLAVQEGSEVPSAFIYVLLFWLTLLFISFGIFAQRNALAIGARFLVIETRTTARIRARARVGILPQTDKLRHNAPSSKLTNCWKAAGFPAISVR
jgi:hypothetical protein